jgi:hypothetical protein
MKKIIIFFILGIFLHADDLNPVDQLKNDIFTKTPKRICQKEQLFIECYDITIADCEILADIIVKACYKQFEQKMLDTQTLAERGKIGREIGGCTAMFYDFALRKANKVNDTCLQQDKWKKQVEDNEDKLKKMRGQN